MPDVTIVYWRDIPAQVIVGKGRRAAKWRKAAPYSVEGEPEEVALETASKLEAEYDTERLKELIAADGWANSGET